LTKFKGNGVLSEIMRDGLWSIVEDAAWQKVREAQRVNQREKKARVKADRAQRAGEPGEPKGHSSQRLVSAFVFPFPAIARHVTYPTISSPLWFPGVEEELLSDEFMVAHRYRSI